MERTSSRRRKPPRVEMEEPRDKPVVKTPENKTTSVQRRSKSNNFWTTLCSSLAACLVILLVYIGSSGNGPFQPLTFPSKKYEAANNSISSVLQLHPEDHIFREPRVQSLNWHITSGHRRPDGVKKRVFLINGWSLQPTHTFCS
jgi:hypothetical protein